MILHVFDDTFTYRGRVENWINMTWTEEFRGEGKFTLVTYDTDKYAEILRHGWYFYRTDRKIAMMAVKVERDTDKNTITVCGYSTLHLLSRRIIDLPVKCTNVEAGIYTLINGDLRGLPYVETAPVKGLTETCEFEIEGEVMLDAVLALLGESKYGIRSNFDHENKKHVIEVYDGVDRTYDSESGGTVFSQEFGNLRSLVATEDDDIYKNVAYVTGADASDPRTIYYQYVSPDAGPQSNWREIIVSGENQEEDQDRSEWQAKQKQLAIEALQSCKNALSFEVELGLGVFGEKYDLGDKVTCKSKRYGLQFDTQIMEYKYSYKSGVESVTVVLGDRPLDYVQSSIIKSSSGGSAKPSGGTGSGKPGADGGVNEIISMTAAEFEALTTEEKAALFASGVRVIAVEGDLDPDDMTDMQRFAAFAHPVGEIVHLTVPTNPATLWGFGTWEAIAAGRVLVGAGTADSGTVYTAGQTGGEETHTLTMDEMPKHHHKVYANDAGTSVYWGLANATQQSTNNTIQTNDKGGDQPHNIMQPYYVCYMWRRTA